MLKKKTMFTCHDGWNTLALDGSRSLIVEFLQLVQHRSLTSALCPRPDRSRTVLAFDLDVILFLAESLHLRFRHSGNLLGLHVEIFGEGTIIDHLVVGSIEETGFVAETLGRLSLLRRIERHKKNIPFRDRCRR